MRDRNQREEVFFFGVCVCGGGGGGRCDEFEQCELSRYPLHVQYHRQVAGLSCIQRGGIMERIHRAGELIC
jgi:hypothetical protein